VEVILSYRGWTQVSIPNSGNPILGTVQNYGHISAVMKCNGREATGITYSHESKTWLKGLAKSAIRKRGTRNNEFGEGLQNENK
jgi:hypothetical protein